MTEAEWDRRIAEAEDALELAQQAIDELYAPWERDTAGLVARVAA